MTLDEKIGAIFIFDAGKINKENSSELKNSVKKLHLCGIIFQADSLQQYINAVNELQKQSKIPLLIGSKTRYGFPDFIQDIYPLSENFPFEVVADDSLIAEYARAISKLNKVSGLNFLLFQGYNGKHFLSQDSAWFGYLANKYSLVMQVIQNYTIIPCMGSFQCTGDTNIQKAIISVYRKHIKEGISGLVLSDDCDIRQRKNLMAQSVYIRNNLHFDGLMVRTINSLQNNFEEEVIKEFNKETDLILTDGNIEKIIKKIKTLIEKKEIDINKINLKVRKTLLAKSWMHLEKFKPLIADSVIAVTGSVRYKGLASRLQNASLVLVKNDFHKIPVFDISQPFTIYYSNDTSFSSFFRQFKFYADYEKAPLFFDEMKKIKGVSIFLIDSLPEKDIIKLTVEMNKIADKTNVAVIHFGPQGNLKYFDDFATLIQVYGKSPEIQSRAVQLLFGGITAKGKLPLTISPKLKYGTGITNMPVTRLAYTIPEEAGIDSEMLDEIGNIANEGISGHAMPGCQVLLIKDGKVVYNRSFGNHTYEHAEPVQWNDLYDLASVTKVAATTLAAMKMYDMKKLSLDKKIGKYFKDTSINYTRIKPDTAIFIDTFSVNEIKKNIKIIKDKDTVYINDSILVAYDTVIMKVTPKLNIFQTAIKDLMIHKSGLPPSMPVLRYIQYRKDKIFFNETPLASRKDTFEYLFNKFYSKKRIKDSAEVQIADGFYLRKEYADTLWNDIKQIKVYSKLVYMYSDVNMNLVQKTIDTINGFGIDEYMDINFYKPMGLRYTCYKPRDKFDKDHIVPTAEDKFWREQLLHGYVHDPAAAMLGGVAGNAGLFSSANDIGIIFQMLLNKGVYGGMRFIDTATVKMFTSRQPDSYRGLGFDMASPAGINAEDAPSSTFGHTGFTGTCVWADPDNKIIYVFLSNRVNPSEKNYRLHGMQIRQRIHQIIYDAVKNSR